MEQVVMMLLLHAIVNIWSFSFFLQSFSFATKQQGDEEEEEEEEEYTIGEREGKKKKTSRCVLSA